MWEVHYSAESANYLADNGGLIAPLFFAIEALAETDGIPTNGEYEATQQSLFYWIIQGHEVVYRRLKQEQIIRILLIRPE